MSKHERSELAVVVTGNPVDGLKFFGPFIDASAANEWADGESFLKHAEWWVAELTPQSQRSSKKAKGVTIEVRGGVVEDCEVELLCQECGATVLDVDGYTVLDGYTVHEVTK